TIRQCLQNVEREFRISGHITNLNHAGLCNLFDTQLAAQVLYGPRHKPVVPLFTVESVIDEPVALGIVEVVYDDNFPQEIRTLENLNLGIDLEVRHPRRPARAPGWLRCN